MTEHLNDEQILDVVDGTADAEAQQHVLSCEKCSHLAAAQVAVKNQLGAVDEIDATKREVAIATALDQLGSSKSASGRRGGAVLKIAAVVLIGAVGVNAYFTLSGRKVSDRTNQVGSSLADTDNPSDTAALQEGKRNAGRSLANVTSMDDVRNVLKNETQTATSSSARPTDTRCAGLLAKEEIESPELVAVVDWKNHRAAVFQHPSPEGPQLIVVSSESCETLARGPR